VLHEDQVRRRRGGLAPGEWSRRGAVVVLRPMTPPAA
jgi:hypothetical protein